MVNYHFDLPYWCVDSGKCGLCCQWLHKSVVQDELVNYSGEQQHCSMTIEYIWNKIQVRDRVLKRAVGYKVDTMGTTT